MHMFINLGHHLTLKTKGEHSATSLKKANLYCQAVTYTNNVDLAQTPFFAVSALDLNFFPMSLRWDTKHERVQHGEPELAAFSMCNMGGNHVMKDELLVYWSSFP